MESLVYSGDKNLYLENVQHLLEIAAYVIPLNLETHEAHVAKYAEKLRWAAQELLKELAGNPVPSIRDSLDSLLVSASEIRVKLYAYYLKNKEAFKKLYQKRILSLFYQPMKPLPVVDIQVVTNNCGECKRKGEIGICNHLPEDISFSFLINRGMGPKESGEMQEVNLHSSTNSCERSTESPVTDRLSATVFDMSLAKFTRRMSEINRGVALQDFRLNKQIPGRYSLTQPVDFLLKLKGVESGTASIDLDDSPVKKMRKSITGLDLGTIEKIQRKKVRNPGYKQD